MIDETAIGERYRALAGDLDERRRRLWAAAEARSHGHGGIAAVARASGIAESTIRAGLRELESGESIGTARVRRAGGGRKPITETDPSLAEDLERLVDPDSGQSWRPRAAAALDGEERAQARRRSARGRPRGLPPDRGAAAALLGLQPSGQRQDQGGQRPSRRDAQFRHINETAAAAIAAGQPWSRSNTNKKELVGDFKNGGREWEPKGVPVEVNTHDFPSYAKGRAIPYGVYDIAEDTGFVNVGIDADTAQFSVASIRAWWEQLGSERYPDASELVITADCGGSNGNRTRLWKTELQRLADETGLRLTVCHFPPGTSKWNNIEHRLFSFISQNWRGKPLVSHKVIVNLIGATTTRTGLDVFARLDERSYPKDVKVSDAELAAVELEGHDFHPEWNYRIAGINRRGERNERVRH